MASTGKDVHLVVLIHGLWGSPAHLAAAKEELENAWSSKQNIKVNTAVSGSSEDPTVTTTVNDGGSEELVMVVAGGMTSQLTYDGVDVCASRVAWEVDQQMERLEEERKRVTKISVVSIETGYSLGGLVARYLIGLLHSRTPSFFDTHRPVSFSTIATPHLGIPRYNTFLSSTLCWLGARMLSRSGEQLYVADRYSDGDPRPLLEIMADPELVFMQALKRFHRVQVFANGVKDRTVPYPTAAIDTSDHFIEWEEKGLEVDADEEGIIRSWEKSIQPKSEFGDGMPTKKRRWQNPINGLPPVLRYRFPFNYIIFVLFPVLLPVVICLMVTRLTLDTRRSQKRLQMLARTSKSSTSTGTVTPRSPIPSASGLSVQGLREAIRRVERGIEADLLYAGDAPMMDAESTPLFAKSTSSEPYEAASRLRLSDSQLRMAQWLNALPISKYVTWYPEVPNSHAVIIVRDPTNFPGHNRGRGLLRRWAEGVLVD